MLHQLKGIFKCKNLRMSKFELMLRVAILTFDASGQGEFWRAQNTCWTLRPRRTYNFPELVAFVLSPPTQDEARHPLHRRGPCVS